MIGVPDRDHAETMLAGFVNGHVHSPDAQGLTHAVIAFDHSRERSLKHHFGLGVQLDQSAGNFLMVPNQSLNSMGLNPRQIRRQQNIRNLAALFLCKMISLKHLAAKGFQLFIRYVMVLHSNRPTFHIVSGVAYVRLQQGQDNPFCIFYYMPFSPLASIPQFGE